MSHAAPALKVLDAVAIIDEQRCIGCTLCIQACPVDAIAGAGKLMHTVIGAACTGCELCVPVCPVDCILMRPLPRRDAATLQAATAEASRRAAARDARLERMRAGQAAAAAAQREESAERKKRETIAKVLERAQARLAARQK